MKILSDKTYNELLRKSNGYDDYVREEEYKKTQKSIDDLAFSRQVWDNLQIGDVILSGSNCKYKVDEISCNRKTFKFSFHSNKGYRLWTDWTEIYSFRIIDKLCKEN